MLVSKNAKICVTPNAKLKICVTPKAKPKCKSVEYRLRWVPNVNLPRWPCTCLSFFWCQFYLRWVPFFSGIWALDLGLGFEFQDLFLGLGGFWFTLRSS